MISLDRLRDRQKTVQLVLGKDVFRRGDLEGAVPVEVEKVLQNVVLEHFMALAADQTFDFRVAENACDFLDLSLCWLLKGDGLELLNDDLNREVLVGVELLRGVCVLHEQAPFGENHDFVPQARELGRGMVLSEFVHRVFGEMRLYEVVTITQPDARDVFVHVDAHLFFHDWGELLIVTAVLEEGREQGLELFLIKVVCHYSLNI